MHNWWIATLEHLGLITQEEAQNIANEIKLGIHREVYHDAFNELGAILNDNHVDIDERLKHTEQYASKFVNLQGKVESLEAKVETLTKALEAKAETEVKKTVASKTKA